MARTCLIIANHSNDIEVLARINLVICLRLSTLLANTLADIADLLSRHRVCDRAVARRFFEANRVVQTRQVARAGSNLILLKVERFNLANQRVLILQTI